MAKYRNDNDDREFEDAWNSSYPVVLPDKVVASWEEFKRTVINRNRRSYILNFRKVGMVAVLLVLFSSYFFFEIYNPVITIPNVSEMEKEIILPDESLVLLKPGSEIKFRRNFKNSRDLKLKGEAHFDVVSDSLNGFTVDTEFTTTTALGTSFLITEKPEQDTRITLYSGRVLVSVKGFAKSWAMTPGESFSYEDGNPSFRKSNSLSFKKGSSYMDLDNTELDKVFEFLEERFGYRFTANSEIKNTKVTLRIKKTDSLEGIIDLLSIINSNNYEVKEKEKEIQVFSK